MADVTITTGDAESAAIKAYDSVLAFCSKRLGNGVWTQQIAMAAGAVVFGLEWVIAGFFGTVFQIGGQVAALFLAGIDDARHQNQEALNQVSAAAIADILAVDVNPADLPTQTKGGTNTDLFAALGGKVLDAITQELAGKPGDATGPGEKAARVFLGRGINFATMSSLIGILGEMDSLGFIKSFADIGEDMERTLGFGRLVRQALHPIIAATITEPYTLETNARYRPKVLSAGEYAAALYSGRMSAPDVQTALSRLGFSNDYITEILAQHKHRMSAGQVETLMRWGKLTRDAAVGVLVAQGMDADTANNELDVLDLQRADAQEHAYAAELLKLAESRYIDSTTYSTLIQRLHFTPAQQQGWLNRVGVYLDSFTKRLTLGEILYLAEHSLITLDQVDKWAADQGYNADAAAMLELWMTQKELDWDAIQKAKAAKKKPPAAPGA